MAEQIERVPLDAETVNGRAAATSALDLLNQAMLYADDARKRAVATSDIDGLMIGLENLSKIAAQLKVVTDSVKADLAALGLTGWQPVGDGEGWVGVEPSHRDTWNVEEVLAAVVTASFGRYMEANEGEIGSGLDLLRSVIASLYACAPLTPSNAWRSTELARLGIDADDYRTRVTTEKVAWAAEPPAQKRRRLYEQFGLDGA